MTTMTAFRHVGWQQPPQLQEIPVPEPGPGEVLIKVAGAGLCHSDLHLLEWPEGAVAFGPPYTLGHENTGWVEQVGPGVEGLEPGDAVAVYGPWGCGRCHACRRSEENYCERAAEIGALGGGLGRDGGMAEYMLIPSARLLVPLEGLDPRDAAPLTDAALTPYHAIKRALPLLRPGSTAVVIGVGGLGQMAVQILRAISPARVVAVDVAPAKLELAREAGADEAVESSAAEEAIGDLTGGLGAELVLDVVGADATLALGAKLARVQGQLTLIGLAGGSFPFNFFSQPYACSLSATYWGSAIELMEVLELARRGAIRPRVERFPLERAAEAVERLRAGEIAGRAVICPNG
jgi:propanol-preferring alcohol dehydrogenase